MATQAQIDLAKQNLPSWRTELQPQWDDAAISAALDQFNGNLNRTVRHFWFMRVSELQPLINMASGGASLNQSQDYEQAREMLRYWDQQLGQASESRTVRIKRRYKRCPGWTPQDDWGYGGVYARTD